MATDVRTELVNEIQPPERLSEPLLFQYPHHGKITRLGGSQLKVEVADDDWGDVEFPVGGLTVGDSDEEELGFGSDAGADEQGSQVEDTAPSTILLQPTGPSVPDNRGAIDMDRKQTDASAFVRVQPPVHRPQAKKFDESGHGIQVDKYVKVRTAADVAWTNNDDGADAVFVPCPTSASSREAMSDKDFDFESEPLRFGNRLTLLEKFIKPAAKLSAQGSDEPDADAEWGESDLILPSTLVNFSLPPSTSKLHRSRSRSCPSPSLSNTALSVIVSRSDEEDEDEEDYDEIIIPEGLSSLKLADRQVKAEDPNASRASDTSMAESIPPDTSFVEATVDKVDSEDEDNEDILSGLEVSDCSFAHARNPHVISRASPTNAAQPSTTKEPLWGTAPRRKSFIFHSIAAATAFASPRSSPAHLHPHTSSPPPSRIPRPLLGSPSKATYPPSRSPETFEMQVVTPVGVDLQSSPKSTSPNRFSTSNPSHSPNSINPAFLRHSFPHSEWSSRKSSTSSGIGCRKFSYTPSSPLAVTHSRHGVSPIEPSRPRIPTRPPAFGSSSPARIPLERRNTFSGARDDRLSPSVTRMIRRPKKNDAYGDGSELDGFEDLPVNRRVNVDRTAWSTPQHRGCRGTAICGGKDERPPSVVMSDRVRNPSIDASKFQERYSIPTNTASRKKEVSLSRPFSPCMTQPRGTDEGDHGRRNRSETPSLLSASKTKSKPSTAKGSPSKQKRDFKKPTLIRNFSPNRTSKTVGDMVYNPLMQRWEGNEGALKRFECPVQTKYTAGRAANTRHATGRTAETPALSLATRLRPTPPTKFTNGSSSAVFHRTSSSPGARPSLITHVSGASSSRIPEVIGKMVFDPNQMRWLSTDGEEEDVFADVEDLAVQGHDHYGAPGRSSQIGVEKYRRPSEVSTPANRMSHLALWRELPDDESTPRRHSLPNLSHSASAPCLPVSATDAGNSNTSKQSLKIRSVSINSSFSSKRTTFVDARLALPLTLSSAEPSSLSPSISFMAGDEFRRTPALFSILDAAEKAHRTQLGLFWPRGFGGVCVSQSLENTGATGRVLGGSNRGPLQSGIRGHGRDLSGAAVAAGRSHLYEIRTMTARR